MLRITSFAAAAALLFVSPAAASVGVWCTGPEGVSFDAPLSGGAGLTVFSATVKAAGRVWTTEAGPEDPQAMVPAQSWGDNEVMWFDFADTNLESNVVEVRLSWPDGGDLSGTLAVIGVGSWDVTCDLG